MFTDRYDRLGNAICQNFIMTNVYVVPAQKSSIVSTIIISASTTSSSYVDILINNMIVYKSLHINPSESKTLVLDNLGISLKQSSTIKAFVNTGPEVYVSLFGSEANNSAMSEVATVDGNAYSVPANKQAIISNLLIHNPSMVPATVDVSIMNEETTTVKSFMYTGQNQKVYQTSDFSSWTTRDLPAASYNRDKVEYVNGVYVFFSASTKKIYTSTDLISWTLVYTYTGSDSWQGVISTSYGNGIYLVCLRNGNNNDRRVVYSNDLASWTYANYGYSIYEAMIIYESTSLNAFIRFDGNTIYKSTDLANWLDTGIYSGGEINTSSIKKILNKYYTFYNSGGSFSRDKLYKWDFLDLSTYGDMKYQPIDLPATVETSLCTRVWKSISYGNGIGLIIARYGLDDDTYTFYNNMSTAYISSDMESWAAITVPAIGLKSNLEFFNGKFVMASSGTSLWYSSSDGVTWQLNSSGTPLYDNNEVTESSSSYIETTENQPTESDVIGRYLVNSQETVLIKSGYTLSGNNTVHAVSTDTGTTIGIFGVEL